MAEKNKNGIKVPVKMVARAAKTSDELVKKVRAGKRQKGAAAIRVQQAEELLDSGINLLVEEVERVVNIKRVGKQ